MWKKSQKTSFLRTLTVIFSAFSARALSSYSVYCFLLGRVNFPFQCRLPFPGLFFWKQGMAQWWERSPPTSVVWVQIPAATPYVGWVCCWFSCLIFPYSSKTNISKFQFDQDSGRWGTTLWMCYLQIIIYLCLLCPWWEWQTFWADYLTFKFPSVCVPVYFRELTRRK